jgi:hypothetical protein
MKKSFCFVSGASLGCQQTEMRGPGRIEDAYIADNSHIADGCEDNVELTVSDSSGNPIRYKPTAATQSIYQQALKRIPRFRTFLRAVKVRFIETGQQVELLCGWQYKPKSKRKLYSWKIRPR